MCSISNPQASGRVLEAVTSKLKKYPFDFRGARILSGEDEGLFGWVTANYLLENFVKVGPPGLSSGVFAQGKVPCPSLRHWPVLRKITARWAIG